MTSCKEIKNPDDKGDIVIQVEIEISRDSLKGVIDGISDRYPETWAYEDELKKILEKK